MANDEERRVLHSVYYGKGGPAALGGLHSVHREAEKRLGRNLSKKDTWAWLDKQHVYIRHKSIRKPKGTRLNTVPIIRTNTGFWDCDLAIFDHSRFHYGLLCIDQLSSYTRVQPMYIKSAESTSKAMKQLIETQAAGEYPIAVRTDRG